MAVNMPNEVIETIEALVLQIPELASIIISYCNVDTSKHLTSVNRTLYKLRSNERLWYQKVQSEFAVIKFKPQSLTFLQQYLTLHSNITITKAAKFGRCDQLRVIRRTTSFSVFDVVDIAIKHDNSCILEYIDNFKNFLTTFKYWDTIIGVNVGIYLVNNIFTNGSENYYILSHLLLTHKLPNNFVNLLTAQSDNNVVAWYTNFTNIWQPLKIITNTLDAI